MNKENFKGNMSLTETERKLLTAAQQGIALTAEPFAELGKEFGLSAEEVVDKFKSLEEKGIIRRFGGVISSKKLGWQSILLAAKIPEEEIYEVVEVLNKHQGVTHNYRRNHDFNLWFTLSVSPEKDLQAEISSLEEETGYNFMQLPKLKQYKLGVKLDLVQQEGEK